jgi:gliding motility-associated-like protein
MKILISFILFSVNSFIVAQNGLVSNPSFEEYESCPQSPSVPGAMEIEKCIAWYSPTLATSDYFHSCNNEVGIFNVSTPDNFAGYQVPYDGDAYTGIYTYVPYSDPCSYSEYIQTKLLTPLKSGHAYFLSFQVSLADYSTGGIKNIGGAFTKHPVDNSSIFGCPIPVTPNVVNQGSFLTDTSSWIQIGGVFIAEGEEEYLTIGCFDVLPVISPIVHDSITFGGHYVYYYIDGIKLYEINLVLPNVITPNNDGVNDAIDFRAIFGNTAVSFTVFNRWGTIVFNNEHINTWSATDNSGNKLSDGVYFYYLTVSDLFIEKSGSIHIFNQ